MFSFLVMVIADAEVYWWHRFAHLPIMYRHVHKRHHQFVIPTPFASYAFHPLDSFMTGLPYMAGCYLFPMHLITFMTLLVFSHLSAFGVHEGYFDVCTKFQKYLVGSAFHSGHHKFLVKNFGHISTFWDVVCGTSRFPTWNSEFMFLDTLAVQPTPLLEAKKKLLNRVLSADLPRTAVPKLDELKHRKLCRKLSILTTQRRIT